MNARDKKIAEQFADALYYKEVARAYASMWLALPDVSDDKSHAECGMWLWAIDQRNRCLAKLLNVK